MSAHMPRRPLQTADDKGEGSCEQACEFDYSGTQACKALKEEGYRVILINSNPVRSSPPPRFANGRLCCSVL
jgi:hypothetical protein